ncbi:MAG: hypothetical protein Tsb002_19770 [Wenzhouxiangellaceae bacterium]
MNAIFVLRVIDIRYAAQLCWQEIGLCYALTSIPANCSEYWGLLSDEMKLPNFRKFDCVLEYEDELGHFWNLLQPSTLSEVEFLFVASQRFADSLIIFSDDLDYKNIRRWFDLAAEDHQFMPDVYLAANPKKYSSLSSLSVWLGLPNEFDDSNLVFFFKNQDQILRAKAFAESCGISEVDRANPTLPETFYYIASIDDVFEKSFKTGSER